MSAAATKRAARITVRQIASPLRRVPRQRAVLTGLGLGRIGRTRELEDTAAVRGMVRKVAHLVEIVGDTK